MSSFRFAAIMAEAVKMSLKEADRYAVIVQVIERSMGQADAAAWLNVSVRQIKPLVRAVRQDGPRGAVSKRWGVPSNRRTAQPVRERFVAWCVSTMPILALPWRVSTWHGSRAAPRRSEAG